MMPFFYLEDNIVESKKLNTEITFEFDDGTNTTMTLCFYKLHLLRKDERFKGLWERYNKAQQKADKADELDLVTIAYTAYVCAHINDIELMSEEEFMIKLGSDRDALGDAIIKMIAPKKAQGLQSGSEKKPTID